MSRELKPDRSRRVVSTDNRGHKMTESDNVSETRVSTRADTPQMRSSAEDFELKREGSRMSEAVPEGAASESRPSRLKTGRQSMRDEAVLSEYPTVKGAYHEVTSSSYEHTNNVPFVRADKGDMRFIPSREPRTKFVRKRADTAFNVRADREPDGIIPSGTAGRMPKLILSNSDNIRSPDNVPFNRSRVEPVMVNTGRYEFATVRRKDAAPKKEYSKQQPKTNNFKKKSPKLKGLPEQSKETSDVGIPEKGHSNIKPSGKEALPDKPKPLSKGKSSTLKFEKIRHDGKQAEPVKVAEQPRGRLKFEAAEVSERTDKAGGIANKAAHKLKSKAIETAEAAAEQSVTPDKAEDVSAAPLHKAADAAKTVGSAAVYTIYRTRQRLKFDKVEKKNSQEKSKRGRVVFDKSDDEGHKSNRTDNGESHSEKNTGDARGDGRSERGSSRGEDHNNESRRQRSEERQKSGASRNADHAEGAADTAQSTPENRSARYKRAEKRVKKAEKQYERAEKRRPRHNVLKFERTFDEKTGKASVKLVKKEELKKPPKAHPVRDIAAIKAVGFAKQKLREGDSNVGKDAMNKGIDAADNAVRGALLWHRNKPIRRQKQAQRKMRKLENARARLKYEEIREKYETKKTAKEIYRQSLKKRRMKDAYKSAYKKGAQKVKETAAAAARRIAAVVKSAVESKGKLIAAAVLIGMLAASMVIYMAVTMFTSVVGGYVDENVSESGELMMFASQWKNMEADLPTALDDDYPEDYHIHYSGLSAAGVELPKLMAYYNAINGKSTYGDTEQVILENLFDEIYTWDILTATFGEGEHEQHHVYASLRVKNIDDLINELDEEQREVFDVCYEIFSEDEEYQNMWNEVE